MKLYDLKSWQKIKVWNKVYKFINIDWVWWNWEDEEWKFFIAFNATDVMDRFLIDNKNKNGETDRVQSLWTWEELGV